MPAWFSKLIGKARRRRRRRLSAPAGTVDHSPVRKADPYAFEAAHRRLAWMLRLSVMTTMALAGVCIVAISAIFTLVPLKEVQLGLVRIEERSDKMVPVDPASLVRVLPVAKDTPGFDIMLDAFVSRYVRILLEIDTVSQDDRMREANRHSDPEFWKKLMNSRLKEIKAALDTGLNRSIVVESVDRISERGGTYRYAVDLVQHDTRDGKVVEVRKLRAYLPVTLRPHTVRVEEQFENPQGFRVLDLALKERGNS